MPNKDIRLKFFTDGKERVRVWEIGKLKCALTKQWVDAVIYTNDSGTRVMELGEFLIRFDKE